MVWSQCEGGYSEYNGECYYNNDLNFLTLLIYLNEIEFELFYDIGLTIWQNGRINTLMLEGLEIHEIPKTGNCVTAKKACRQKHYIKIFSNADE